MRRVAAGVALLLVLGACSPGGGDGRATAPVPTTTPAPSPRPVVHTSPGCQRPDTARAGLSEHTMTSGGVVRHYELDVPAPYDGRRPYAIVLGLHALTVSYQFVPAMTGFDQGSRYHFIGVAPSGRLDGSTPFWDAAPTRDNYDVAFIAKLLDHLEATLCVDPARVFSTGMSNGAQMSSLLACRLSGRIAAIAPVAGEEYLAPCDGTPVPILAFHGTADPILPYRGGGLNATTIANNYYWKGHEPAGLPAPLGIDASMRDWAAHNGCDARYVEERIAPRVVRRTWRHCAAATVLYIVEGGGHSWPGQPVPQFEKTFGPGTTEINATDLMFRLFFGRSAR